MSPGIRIPWQSSLAPALAATALLLAAPTQARGGVVVPDATGCDAVTGAARVGCLINRSRRSHGLPPLARLDVLDRAATFQADSIARCGQFSHTPCGRPFGWSFRAAGFRVSRHRVAENLAWGTGELGSPEETVRHWLASPPHRRNILSRRFGKLGVATVTGTIGGHANASLWVVDFASG
jgi:uncharacterized protein YkwD